MTTRSAWLLPRSGAGGQTREDTRLAPLGAMTPDGILATRPGVMPGGGYQVTGTGMTATVGIGRGIVQGTTAQGPIPVFTSASEAIVIPDGTGQPRIDLIIVRAYENAYDSLGMTKVTPERVAGTPQAVPVAPTPPVASIVLAEIRVEGNSSAGNPLNWAAALTDRRQYTAAIGAIHPGSDSAAGAYIGQWRDNPVTGALERWSGAAWVPWPSALRGIAPGSLASGSYTGQWRDGSIGLERWSGSAWGKAAGEYQSFTPAWTGSVTNPTLGNGSLTSRWCRVGRKIHWYGSLVLGTTSNGGTGTWNLSLPVTAANFGILSVGSCVYINAGDNQYVGVTEVPAGGTAAGFVVKTSTSSQSADGVSNAVPVGASFNSRLHWSIEYEAAS